MGRAHKETNTYRFKNFTDRIKEKHIDVVHQLRSRIVEDTGEESTYFGDGLAKWLDLNCTQSFVDFQEEIEKYPCTTYIQLVHNAEPLLQVLLRHLQIPETMALEPLLDLLVQMARDVGPDFYPHFHGIFEILVSLLDKNSKDFTALERIFETMAFLYKFLWRHLVHDIKNVYGYFSELLKSSKEHIRRFAAESFAFLMRKVKAHEDLFQFLFSDLQSSRTGGEPESDLEGHQEKMEGVAQLVFEMIKGVKGRFHTCSEQVFRSVLHALEQPSVVLSDLVEQTIKRVMEECATHSEPQHAGQLWKVLLTAVTDAQKSSSKQFHCLLRLSNIWLGNNFITDPNAVSKALTSVLKNFSRTEKEDVLLSAVSSLLLQASDQLSVESSARLVTLVFSSNFKLGEVETFSRQLLKSALFEKDILPGLLSFMSRHFDVATDAEKSQMVSILADVILGKMVVPEDGSQLERLQCFPLDFGRTQRGQKSAFIQHIQTVVKQASSVSTREKITELFCALVCLPHISTLDSSAYAMDIVSAFQYLSKSLSDRTGRDSDYILFVIRQAVLSLLVLRDRVDVHNLLPTADLIALLKFNPSSYHALHTADLYLNSRNLTSDLLEDVYLLLEPNLVSWSHKVRLCTVHLLSLFPVSVPGIEKQDGEIADDGERWTIFTVALAAERVPVTVQDYRQRLMYLRKMDKNIVHAIMPAGPYSRMPVLYLMGTFLCPLTLLWEPVTELIATYARGLEREEFWEPFSRWLKFAAVQAAKSPEKESKVAGDCDNMIEKWMSSECQSERPPDFTAFRNQLWKAMSLFPDKCEPKSKDIVPLFLDFLQEEYYVKDLSVAPSENIKMAQATLDANDGTAEEETDEVMGTSNEKKTRVRKDVKKISAVQSLLSHLELFSKMRNPRSLYKEEKLRDIFFQFLEHKNSRVQTLAFRCIMTYKHKFLIPYRENFDRLLDDKTFKSEVVLFSVDQDVTPVSPEHRPHLLPFLLRILYGKMLSKTGNETAGKRKADVRRSIVFRFLAGCTATEMQQFLDLVFGPLKSFVTDDPLKMVKECFSVDITNVVPPKRLKGVLGAVMITEKLGTMLAENARSILHLLLGMAATCTACLQHREVLKPSAANILKSVRQMVFGRLIQFFQEFYKFQFTDQESEAILEACVWPQLERLNLESKCQPSSVLRLIQAWCQDPRYFPFLTKEAPRGDNSPLRAMFSLLVIPGVGRPVSAVILKSVESLLEGEEDEDEPPHKRRKSDLVKKPPSMGDLLVRQHVPALLTFIESAVMSLASHLKEKGGKEAASKEALLELKILARISVYIDDESQAVRLCSLLMPFLSSGFSLQQDLEESTLESMLNLMTVVTNPRLFFKSLVPLFVTVERRQSRALLCQTVKVIGCKVPELTEIADAIENLNAWNPSQAEEPDYTARLNTFTNVMQQMRDWTKLDIDFIMPLIYNCCFFMKNFAEDFSIRENATLCLSTIIQRFKALNSDPNLYKEVMVSTVLTHVKKGLRSKNENVRHEFLAALQTLVVAFPDQRDFLGLAGLQDTDVDADFFENIKSIQLHKQAKALRRLSHYLRTHRLRADQHMGYFIPLVYTYIIDGKRYGKSAKLLDAAVDLTCMMCRQLPWESYYQLLRLYLSHLPRHLDLQRTIVRMIVAILDGFHFDLTQSQFKFSTKPKLDNQSARGPEKTPPTLDTTLPTTSTSTEVAPATTDTGQDEVMDMAMMEAAGGQEQTAADAGTMENSGVADLEYTADRKDLCAPGLATRIHRMILQRLIPQLHKTLTEKVKSDEIHKMAGVKYAEDEEVLRVPIAMAMIKLLQKMPDQALRHKLPGIILRVCNFLKSRAQDIRKTARDTLVKAVQAIGANYLLFIIKEMRQVLTRGYQRHVLSYSVHHLLKSIKDMLKPGDLDAVLDDLHAIYQEELFGAVAEEKMVEGIKAKVFEAKTIKGDSAYHMIAQFISPACVGALVQPLKKVLEGTHSRRVSNKVRTALQYISKGLLVNSTITVHTLMVFVHSLTADNLSFLYNQQMSKAEENSLLSKPGKPEHCLLLVKANPHCGMKPKTSKKTTLDVLVEFGLLLLHSCLKNGTLKCDEPEHLGFLEPLVLPLLECLNLEYVRVNSAALRCFERLLTFPLPTLKLKVKAFAEALFKLLRNYSKAGASQGDNQELVFTCFKAVTVLVRDVKHFKPSNKQLEVLLPICEEDLDDITRQGTAFSLLKAILKRHLDVPALHELLALVQTKSITAEAHHLRAQCREVIMQYLKTYRLGKEINKHFVFYAKHLRYELEDGRMSALKMLHSIFSTFDEKVLKVHAEMVFVLLSASMYSDESKACRTMAYETTKVLLEKTDFDTRDKLFNLVMEWANKITLMLPSVAAQLCGMFVQVEGVRFAAHQSRGDVLQVFLDKDITLETDESQRDKYVFQVMTLILKTLKDIDLPTVSAWTDIQRLFEYVEERMLHEHSWVRLLTSQIVGQVLSLGDVTTYFSLEKGRRLIQKLCHQLQVPALDEELAMQVVKNLVFLAREYNKLDPKTAQWVTKKIIKEANYETINNPQVTVKRRHVFTFIAAIGNEFDGEVVTSILPAVLPALQREEHSLGKDETLRQLAVEVMDRLKRKTGVEAFSKVYTAAQTAQREKKEKRKQKRAVDTVNHPEIAAAKRMKKNKTRNKPKREQEMRKRVSKTKLNIFHMDAN